MCTRHCTTSKNLASRKCLTTTTYTTIIAIKLHRLGSLTRGAEPWIPRWPPRGTMVTQGRKQTLHSGKSLELRGFLPPGFLCCLQTIPFYSTPTQPRPSQPHSKNKPHTLHALGVTVSCLYGHGGSGPEGFSSSGQLVGPEATGNVTERSCDVDPEAENPRRAPPRAGVGPGKGNGPSIGLRPLPGLVVACRQHGLSGYWPRASRLTEPRTRNSTSCLEKSLARLDPKGFQFRDPPTP